MKTVRLVARSRLGTLILLVGFLLSLSAHAELPVDDGVWVEIGPPIGSIGGLAADPQEPALVIAATTSDWIFRSTDGGVNWSRGTPLAFGGRSNSIHADPHQHGVFYALTSTVGQILRSTDEGLSWEPVDGSPGASIGSFATDPSNPGVLYVGTRNAGLFRSTDSGDTLTRIDADSEFFTDVTINEIAVDPTDAGHLFIGTPTQEPGTVRATFDDDKWSFESVNDGLFNPRSATLSFDADGNVYASLASTAYEFDESSNSWQNLGHPDNPTYSKADPRHVGVVFTGESASIHRTTTGGGFGNWELEFDQFFSRAGEFTFSDTPLMAARYFGVFRRDADSLEAGNWQISNTGMNAAVVTSVLVDPDTPGRYLAGLRGPGLMESLDSGRNWTAFGDGLDPGDSVRILRVSEFESDRYFATQSDDIYLSDDAGATWINLDPDGDITRRIVSLVEEDQATLFLASGNAIVRGDISNPADVTWTNQHDGLPDDPSLAGIARDPVGGRYYAMTRTDGLFMAELEADELVWEPVADDISGSPFFSHVLVDKSARKLYATTTTSTGRIYRLDLSDPDAVFERVHHDLPGTSLLILFRPGGDDRLVANINDSGTFYSDDHGETWQTLGEHFPFRLFDLVEDSHNPGQYLAATSNASVARLITSQLFSDRFEDP
jgi:photosystem II stability/assembly factor-like uncharacterized protein